MLTKNRKPGGRRGRPEGQLNQSLHDGCSTGAGSPEMQQTRRTPSGPGPLAASVLFKSPSHTTQTHIYTVTDLCFLLDFTEGFADTSTTC